MAINVNKSSCLRIGPRCNVICRNIVTHDEHLISWVDEVKYLGIHINNAQVFKCTFSDSKKAFYRSVNAIFSQVGRVASEEITLQLVSTKCIPMLLYGVEACPVNRSVLDSFDFTVNRFLMKLFQTSNINVIVDCITYFNFKLPSALVNGNQETEQFVV